jgi:hypothetical protein
VLQVETCFPGTPMDRANRKGRGLYKPRQMHIGQTAHLPRIHPTNYSQERSAAARSCRPGPRELLLPNRRKAERVGFEPTRRLNTAYAISDLKMAPYQLRAGRPNLSHFVRLVWPLATFREVLMYSCVHCVRSRTGPVAVRLRIGCTLVFAAVLHLFKDHQPLRVQNSLL